MEFGPGCSERMVRRTPTLMAAMTFSSTSARPWAFRPIRAFRRCLTAGSRSSGRISPGTVPSAALACVSSELTRTRKDRTFCSAMSLSGVKLSPDAHDAARRQPARHLVFGGNCRRRLRKTSCAWRWSIRPARRRSAAISSAASRKTSTWSTPARSSSPMPIRPRPRWSRRPASPGPMAAFRSPPQAPGHTR